MVTTHSMYIKKWWCMMPRRPKIEEGRFTILKVIFQNKATKMFWRPKNAILCRTMIHSHQQEQFDDHMNSQNPHHRGLSQMTNKCSFPKHVWPSKSLDMWLAQCGLVLVQIVSFTMVCWIPSLESCVDIPTRARRGELTANPAYVGFEDTLAQLKRRCLRWISCAKGTMNGDRLDQPQGCAGMRGDIL